MTTLTLQPSNSSLLSPTSSTAAKKVSADTESSAITDDASAPAEGIKVSLSEVGIGKSKETRGPNSDIEESGLPEQAQKILKTIRELQQKIKEKLAEIQKIKSDQEMDPEAKKTKMAELQNTLASLSASLMTANSSLKKLSSDGILSASDMQKANELLMKN